MAVLVVLFGSLLIYRVLGLAGIDFLGTWLALRAGHDVSVHGSLTFRTDEA
jgi:hypothetical protein